MYCLVRYIEDNILNIVRTRSLSEIEKNKLYWAPYKRMGYYEAVPLYYSDNRHELEIQQKLQEPVAGGTSVFSQNNNNRQEKSRVLNQNNRNKDVNKENHNLSKTKSSSKANIYVKKTENKPKGRVKIKKNTQYVEQNIPEKRPKSINVISNITVKTGICHKTDILEKIIDDKIDKTGKEIALNVDNIEKNVDMGIAIQGLTNYVANENESEQSTDAANDANTKDLNNHERFTKSTHKQHSCYYCKKVLYQLPRHFVNVHFKEPEVKEILSLHPSNPDRKKKIDELRKKGDFNYNQTSNNKEIVTRESNLNDAKYVPCHSCLGYYTKNNLRHHIKNCLPHKGDRSLQSKSRKLMKYVHDRASQVLRNFITPNMYQDEISNNFLFDEMIILYGNYLCIKYTDTHLKSYIRAQLRLLGRFMMETKILDPNIKCFKDLMHPTHIDTIRNSINLVAGLDENTGTYTHPTNARTLGTEFKKLLEVVQSECDKKEDGKLMKSTKSLARLFNLEITPYVNRICKLSENRYRRKKNTYLPENEEIEKYLKYLLNKVSFYCTKLQTKYSFDDWDKLSKYTLVALIVFNRKRPGETQRLELEDFYRRESVTERDRKLLNEEEKLLANKYVRVAFRGKLGNSTALLIDKCKILPGIKMLLNHRQKAGVHPKNRFLFAYPSIKDENKTYEAYRCHQQLLEESGLKSPSLTFTSLRKQFATQVAKEGPSHEDERRVSNYMSHDYKIHKQIYDQSATLVDITKVSKHLEASANCKHIDDLARIHKTKKKRDTEIENVKETKIRHCSDKYKTNKSESTEKMMVGKLKSKYLRKDNVKESDDDYIANSSEEEEELDPTVQCHIGKFKQRTLWTSEEKSITRKYFDLELNNKCPISNADIKTFKETYSGLMKNRSIPMIKQWLQGEINRQELNEHCIPEKRPRYSTPEKEIIEKSFERHSLNGSEPSIAEIEEVIANNDILKKRSVHSVLHKFKSISKNN